MPTIIAICPYCRAGGVRAPDTALGASATCPKCKSSFTVLPETDPPEWVEQSTPDAPSFSAPGPAKPKSSPLEETRTTPAMPDVTEPSPVLPAEPRKKTEPKPEPALQLTAPVTSSELEDEAPDAPSDLGMTWALAALILVGPTVLVSQLPFGRFVAAALALVGLVGGVLCLGAEGRARLLAALAALLHLVVLVVVVFLPSWLNLDPWRGPPLPEEPKTPVAVEQRTGASSPITPNDWLDAGKFSWQFRDTRVTARAAVGPVELNGPNGAKRITKEPYLQLTLQVRNVGFEREIPLSGWAAGQGTDGVRATDATGKVLAPATFENGWTVDRGKVMPRAMPGHASEAVLLFAAPPAKTEFVRVQLSGPALGVPDEIKFRVGTIGAVLRPPGP
jgi:hypothetical protein